MLLILLNVINCVHSWFCTLFILRCVIACIVKSGCYKTDCEILVGVFGFVRCVKIGPLVITWYSVNIVKSLKSQYPD